MPTLVHGGDIYAYEDRPREALLDYSANINPLGLPQGVRRAVVEAVSQCQDYPDPLCRKLTRAIAGAEGLPEEWILCGNGASDLIYRLAYALRPRRALVLAPCFAEYEQALLAAGCRVERHILLEEEEFRLTQRVLEELTEDLDLVFLCSPNNPTGQPIERPLLEQILARCREKGIFLALDECFNDFLDTPEEYTMKPWLGENPHLMIFRAFTKMYAIPGLRLGHCFCSRRELLEKLYVCGSPWGVSSLAQAAGVRALEEREYVAQARALVRQERGYLKQGLARLGCRVYGSQANYIFFRPHVPQLCGRLERQGILLRDCSNFHGLSGRFCRMAVRTRPENRRVLEAMEQAGERP